MTDVIEGTATEDSGWNGEDQSSPVTYPESPANPHNHRFTVSMNGQGPMVVVRGNTAEEIRAGFDELEGSGFGAYIAAFWAGVQAAKNMAQGLGAAPAQGAPQAPVQGFQAPPAQQFQGPNTPPPFGPNVSVPQAPGFQPQGGFQAPPAQQWGGGGQQQGERKEYPAPQGWYRLNGARKEQVDAVAGQAGIPKGNPSKGGHYNFFGLPQKSWYCSPQAAQAFAQFNPVPA
jgi:hypothetical protein